LGAADMGKKHLVDFFKQFSATLLGVLLALYYQKAIPASQPAWVFLVSFGLALLGAILVLIAVPDQK
jgi:Na+-translocating ferredoxin:NAD+ oxidoreductase RnfD subunit